MTELNEKQLVLVDDENNEVLCNIIFTHYSEEYKKNYVFFYREGSEDENGRYEVNVASYIPKDGGMGELLNVEDDEEWQMLADLLDQYLEEHEECDEDCDCCDEDCDCCDDDCDDDCCCSCCHHSDDEDK